LRHIVLPGRHALETLVASFVERQRSGEKATPDTTVAPLLGNLLSGVNARHLIVLPDGPLNGMPFAALPLPRSQAHELLVDRFRVTSAPSLALGLLPASHRLASSLHVAVVSDPVYTPDDRRLSLAASQAATFRGADSPTERLSRLPYSAIEARAVARAFRDM